MQHKEIDLKTQYAQLQRVLDAAYAQASDGKGRARHAELNEPFEQQKICEITRRLKGNVAAGALFQAVKKCYESGRLPKDRAIAELYGAINYIGAAILVIEEQPEESKPNISIRVNNFLTKAIEKVQKTIAKAFHLQVKKAL